MRWRTLLTVVIYSALCFMAGVLVRDAKHHIDNNPHLVTPYKERP